MAQNENNRAISVIAQRKLNAKISFLRKVRVGAQENPSTKREN